VNGEEPIDDSSNRSRFVVDGNDDGKELGQAEWAIANQ
jgi:hypothetical protein